MELGRFLINLLYYLYIGEFGRTLNFWIEHHWLHLIERKQRLLFTPISTDWGFELFLMMWYTTKSINSSIFYQSKCEKWSKSIHRCRGGHEWPQIEKEAKKDHGQAEILRKGAIRERFFWKPLSQNGLDWLMIQFLGTVSRLKLKIEQNFSVEFA